jgi:hypothetical protein
VDLPILSTFEVRSVHVLASLYQRFIRNFSDLCVPLTTCMRKCEFQWNTTLQKGFELLKKKVTKKLVLASLNFGKVFQIDCDVNKTTIGVVLNKEEKVNYILQ